MHYKLTTTQNLQLYPQIFNKKSLKNHPKTPKYTQIQPFYQPCMSSKGKIDWADTAFTKAA